MSKSIKPAGKTYALSVADSAHNAVTIGADTADFVTRAAFLNTGTTVVGITLSNGDDADPVTPALPTDGSASTALLIVLPASMTAPIVFDVPRCPFVVKAIGSAAGPSVVYITPCEV